MAVEAHHLNFFNNGYGLQPLSGTTTGTLEAMYNNTSPTAAAAAFTGVSDTFPAQVAVKTESGLSYAFPVSRKRPREAMNPLMTCQKLNGNSSPSFTFFGEDVSLQMMQQQQEIDQLIALHNNEIRREIEEKRRRNTRTIISSIERGIVKSLKAKDDEIEKIGKLNWALQEKVKSLYVEGQIWRDLAHTNEATVQALRSNLEHVLSSQLNKNEQDANDDVANIADDAQSCCGSNYREEEGEECGTQGGRERKCRKCGEGESNVLVLPCRHLCLCASCGSSVHTCPVCQTPKNASVQVIISS